MSTGEVTPLHEGWRYKTLTGNAEESILGASTHKICQIIVPFEHILRKAVFGAAEVVQNDANDVITFRRVQPGGSVSGQIIGTSALNVDSSNLGVFDDVALVVSDEDMPVGTIYFITAVFDDASDEYVNAALSIMVSPIPPGPA